MALLNAGTATTTTLKALLVAGNNSTPGTNIQNVAAFNAYAKNQDAAAKSLQTTIYMTNGLLYLPGNRGVIQCLPGDYVMIDPVSGWPIMVSANAVAGGSFVHS